MTTHRSEPWFAEPFALDGVPTMISRAEQKYLHWLTRTQWRDEGYVVEIGPWLGGSTVCLASGMSASGHARHQLHVFDNFVWRDFMARFAPLPLRGGESFEPFFLRNVAAHADRVVSHALTLPDEAVAGDAEASDVRGAEAPPVAEFAWDTRLPVEILFVDGAKSWRGMRCLLRAVAPALIPGKTLLVCQDFKHWGSSWVPLMIARIAPELELVHIVHRGSTATFRLKSALDPARFDALVDDVARLDTQAALADIERMAEWIASSGDPTGACNVRLGAVQLLVHHGRQQQALEKFEEIQSNWPLRGGKGQLHDARRYLSGLGLEPQPYRAWKNALRRLIPGVGR